MAHRPDGTTSGSASRSGSSVSNKGSDYGKGMSAKGISDGGPTVSGKPDKGYGNRSGRSNSKIPDGVKSSRSTLSG